MQKILLSLSISLGSCTLYSQTEKLEYYADSVLKKECLYAGELKACSFYYPNGQLNVSQRFKRQLLEGQQNTYDTLGNLLSVEYFIEDERQDTSKYFYANGQLRRVGIYKDDFYEGEWLSFYSNGVLKQKGNYKNGQPTGLWLFYDENKKLTFEIEFLNGKKHGKYLRYHSRKNKIVEERFYKNNVEIKP